MRLFNPSFVLLLAVALTPGTASADTFTITEWALSTGVRRHNPFADDWDHCATVVNPLVLTQTAILGASQGHSCFDFAWAESFGTFLIQSDQEAVGLSSSTVDTVSAGFMRLSVTEPLPLHIDAAWSYSLPADFMMTLFAVGVYSADSPTVLFHQSYNQQTMPGEPSSGTLPIQGDVILTPGETWLIQYWMELEADAGPDFSATGNGYVSMTIPEPTTLALLALLLLAIPRRTARRRAH